MNLLEAIQNCGENWFRPVFWSGKGIAYEIVDDMLMIRDGFDELEIENCVKLLTGEWEIVTPEQVMKENN